MVRFSDLLGHGDDDESRPSDEGEARSEATPNEPVPPPPGEPPPPPPPASSGNDLLDQLTDYSAPRTVTPPPPPPPPSAPEAGPEPAADQAVVETLGPVDDDLLPRRRTK
jgi:hypothetical protein